MKWKLVKEGKDICPNCRIGTLEAVSSWSDWYQCNNCDAIYTPEKE